MADICPDITIPDSKTHEFDPIHGIPGDTVNIVCNDGYIFNHDLMHQGGKLTCMQDISGSTYNWYVDNEYANKKCGKILDSKECNGVSPYPPPSYNPYEQLGLDNNTAS